MYTTPPFPKPTICRPLGICTRSIELAARSDDVVDRAADRTPARVALVRIQQIAVERRPRDDSAKTTGR